MARRLLCLWTVAALITMGTTALGQQGRSELRGRVTDDTGGALPGVNVVVTNQDTGTFRELVTSGDGTFFAAQLIPGVFTISAELAGFRGFRRTDFAIGVGNTLDIDIVLEIGALEETITVSGEAPLVDLTSAEVGGHRHEPGAGRAAHPEPQRLRGGGAAAGHPVPAVVEPGQRHHDRQRADPQRQLDGGRRGHEQRRHQRLGGRRPGPGAA